MKTVSVIIATRNRAELLPRAIESAFAAGGRRARVEVVVVDDASSDATPEVCRAFSSRIRCVRLARRAGLAAARNAGIRASSGEFIALLDDDDARLPGSLDAQLEVLENARDSSQAALVYGQVLMSPDAPLSADATHAATRKEQSIFFQKTPSANAKIFPSHCPSGDVFWRLLEGNFIPVLSVVARREAMFEVGLFDPDLPVIEDWDLWLRLCERWPVIALPEAVAVYRVANAQSRQLSSRRVLMWSMCAKVQRRALAMLPRARSASREQVQKVRRDFLRHVWEKLIADSIKALHASSGSKDDDADVVDPNSGVRLARASVWMALRLMPFESLRSGIFHRLFFLAWLPAFSARNADKDSRCSRKRRKKLKRLRADFSAAVSAKSAPLNVTVTALERSRN